MIISTISLQVIVVMVLHVWLQTTVGLDFFFVSGAWRISSEEFLKDNDLFSDLKLRLSYGTNGLTCLQIIMVIWVHILLLVVMAHSQQFSGVRMANEKLSWGKSHNFNIGLDWTLYNRVTLTFDFINKLTKDLLFQMPVSSRNWFQ